MALRQASDLGELVSSGHFHMHLPFRPPYKACHESTIMHSLFVPKVQ